MRQNRGAGYNFSCVSTILFIMLQLYRRVKPFILTSVVFFAVSILFITFLTKEELHLLINGWNTPFLDQFFRYATYLGDGLVVILLVPVFAYFRKKKWIKCIYIGLATCLGAGITAQFFKKVVFKGSARPIAYLGEENLHLVEGVKVHHWNTFPSGHTASIYALMLFCTFIFPGNRIFQIFCAMIAFIVALSRVYLSQHFLEDIVGGMFLSVFLFFLILKSFYLKSEEYIVEWS